MWMFWLNLNLIAKRLARQKSKPWPVGITINKNNNNLLFVIMKFVLQCLVTGYSQHSTFVIIQLLTAEHSIDGHQV